MQPAHLFLPGSVQPGLAQVSIENVTKEAPNRARKDKTNYVFCYSRVIRLLNTTRRREQLGKPPAIKSPYSLLGCTTGYHDDSHAVGLTD